MVVNGQDKGEPVVLLRRADGGLLVPRANWTAWRLGATGMPTTTQEGVQYVALQDVKGVRFSVDEAAQSLSLSVSPELFGASQLQLGRAPLQAMTPSRVGGFLNYDVLAERSDGVSSVNAAVEAGIFAHGGIGLTNFVGGWHNGDATLVRLDTSWTIDDPARHRSLRFGDSISGGGTGGSPVRFGGVQFGSNFAVEPGFVTQPLPTVRGSAALPSVVDIYVNKTLAGRRDVAPGPFSILDLPAVTGSGDVQLVVRDALGRETLVTQSYYAAPQLLRAGLTAFSYEVGFLRRDYAVSSNDYGPLMASATHRVGLSDALTAEFHGEATRSVQQAGASATMVWDALGAVSLSGAASTGRQGSGALAGAAFERRTRGLSLGVSAQYTTNRYTSIGYSQYYRLGALDVQGFMGMPVSFGSVGLSYLLRDQRGGPDLETVGANATVRVPRLGMLHIAARQSLRSNRETAIQMFFTFRLKSRTSASTSAQYEGGRATWSADIQRNPPVGDGLGYRASVTTGAVDRIAGAVTAQTPVGTYQVEAARTNGLTGVRVEAAGGIGMVGSDVFASRTLSQSFAVVHVGQYDGVRVYADNQLIGRTNTGGTIVIPRLRPFDRNEVRIDVADLPMDTQVSGAQQVVRPFNRNGVTLDFDARRERGATLTVQLEDGSALPDGAKIVIQGVAAEYISAPGGEVYLGSLRDSNVISAQWGSKSCRFNLDLAPSQEIQPDLGRHVCKMDRL